MSVWWVQALANGFTDSYPVTTICGFRVVFASACLLKFVVEAHRGYRHYYQPGTFLYELNHTDGQAPWVNSRIYSVAYSVRSLAALLLLLGIYPQVAAGLLCLCFMPELRVYFKFHACFMCLCSGALMFEPGLGAQFSVASPVVATPGAVTDGFSAFLICVTTAALYLLSAIRKLRSKDFRSGRVLWIALYYQHKERHRKNYAESWYPRWFIRNCLPQNTARQDVIWHSLALATIALESLIPVLLSFDSMFAIGAGVGILLHLGFTAMLPVTLFHFSLVSISSYLCFLNPAFA